MPAFPWYNYRILNAVGFMMKSFRLACFAVALVVRGVIPLLAAEPPASGWIHGKDVNGTNTGVPPSIKLTAVKERLVVTEDWISAANGGSRVIEGKRFLTGSYLTIKTGDVTVRHCSFEGTAGVLLGDAVRNVAIEDSEFDGKQENLGAKQAIKNDRAQLTLLRLNIHHWPRALTVTRGETAVINCYFHDLTCDGVQEAHKENIYVAGGANQSYIGNKLIANAARIRDDITVLAISAALAVYNQGGGLPDLERVSIIDNYFDGDSSYALYCGSVKGKKGAYATAMTVRGNVFGRTYQRKCGKFGPATAYDGTRPGNAWENNVWGDRGGFWQAGDPDRGAPVEAPRAK